MRLLYKLLWNGSTELNFSKISINKKEKIKGNKMTITFENKTEVLANNEIIFDEGDGVQLFAKYDYDGSVLDTSASGPDLLFNGRIKTFKFKTDTKWRCTVECIDFSYDVLNKLWGQTFQGKTAPYIVQTLVQWASRDDGGEFESNGVSYDVDSSIDITSPYDGIQGKRPDGSDFPNKTIGMAHKPVFEFIDAVSRTEYTNSESEINNNQRICTRPMKYYIDRNNKFQWFHPNDTPDHFMEYGATSTIGDDTNRHRIISDDLEYGTFNDINFIIYKAGEDMDNVQILDYELDPTAESLKTADSYRAWEDIARSMKREDLAEGNITFVKGDEYNYPTSYPVNPAWIQGSTTVSTDNEYNNAFIEEAIRRADARARDNFTKTGDLRWKAKITLYGEILEPTELIRYTRSEYGLINKLLRISSVNHTIDKSSFITVIDAQEDEVELN